MSDIYDVIIIGGGPAGSSAAVYASRKKIKTLLITDSFGGQSVVSDKIGNWIGEIEISGPELAKKLENHVKAQEDIDIKEGEKAVKVKKSENIFEVLTNKNNKFQTKTVIVCTGGRRRKLKVPGAEKYDGKGISYCSTCDAPLFKDKAVAVVGGGNAGLEAVIDLFPYAKEIYLLNRGLKPTGDPATLEEVKKSKKTTIINNADTVEISGDLLVNGLKYKNLESGEIKELMIGGIFIEIGSLPNSEIVKDLVETDEYGEIIIEHQTSSTSVPGIFAAGDVIDEIYKQNSIAVGDAVRAALSAYNYLLNIKKKSPAKEKK
jgi:NADH-dependent peroxiredoxin subunit F